IWRVAASSSMHRMDSATSVPGRRTSFKVRPDGSLKMAFILLIFSSFEKEFVASRFRVIHSQVIDAMGCFAAGFLRARWKLYWPFPGHLWTSAPVGPQADPLRAGKNPSRPDGPRFAGTGACGIAC